MLHSITLSIYIYKNTHISLCVYIYMCVRVYIYGLRLLLNPSEKVQMMP